MSTAVSVFISYSHDSDLHKQQILALSNRLRGDGIDCFIDQYEPAPPEGWPRKMDKGIRDANYVLMVCTETYLRRLQLEEEEGKGLGVAWEGSLIYNTLYRDRTLNHKFIPVLLQSEDETHVPTILFGNSRYDLSQPRGYDNLYRHLRGELGVAAPPLGLPRFVRTIDSDELPTVEGELFGRKDELVFLDSALADADVNIVELVASGGTGKTKLLRHWLDNNKDKIEALIAWSFYSQGSSEDKQISATPFFIQALSELGADKSVSDFNTEEEKGAYVADLLCEKRCLLVLDGLEPLQQVGRGMRGELKDRAIRKMLRNLASSHTSLCIITTRLAVHELKGRKAVLQHNLQNLQPYDGVALLRSFTEPHQVYGREPDLLAAVDEYGCHALALHLLGNALATYLDGDVRQRDTLTELIGDYDDVERHAFKVMQAYQRWLAGTPELKLLYLLGLFDHPVDQDVLEVLWNAEIPELTSGVPLKAWKVAQRDLTHKLRMMSAHDGRDDLFDCHPLIREYFGSQLKEQFPGVWKQAHTILYEYYKTLPEKLYGKFLPDTLEEMQPLLRAVAHGCKSGDFHEIWREVIWERIERKPRVHFGDVYLLSQLGGWQDNLQLMRNYFANPWSNIQDDLSLSLKRNIYNRTTVSLHSLGRLSEAQVLQETLSNEPVDFGNMESRESAVVDSYSFTLTLIELGSLSLAKRNAQATWRLAHKVESSKSFIVAHATLARVHFLMGDLGQAKDLFEEAERVMVDTNPGWILHSIYGAFYNELTLDIGSSKLVRQRTMKNLKTFKEEYSSLSRFTDELLLVKSWLIDRDIKQACSWLEKARSTLELVDILDEYANFYLVEVELKRSLKEYRSAHTLLQQVYDIAEPSGMRLHLTDYHLEMARLILAVEADQTQYSEATPDREQRVLPFADQGEPGILTLQEHITAAERLINETGYHRRDKELNELKQQVEMC